MYTSQRTVLSGLGGLQNSETLGWLQVIVLGPAGGQAQVWENRVRGYCGPDRSRKTRQAGFLPALLLSEGAEGSRSMPGVQVRQVYPKPAIRSSSPVFPTSSYPPPLASTAELGAPSRSSLSTSLAPPMLSHPAWDCVISKPGPELACCPWKTGRPDSKCCSSKRDPLLFQPAAQDTDSSRALPRSPKIHHGEDRLQHPYSGAKGGGAARCRGARQPHCPSSNPDWQGSFHWAHLCLLGFGRGNMHVKRANCWLPCSHRVSGRPICIVS